MSQKERREEKPRDNPKAAGSLSPEEARTLLEDLRLHQAELEMQNKELKRAQQVIEESREKFSDLYDFSPVAYLTLDWNSVIEEANLTAATLLDMERHQLIGKTFFSFVTEEYRDRYFEHHQRVIKGRHKETGELQMVTRGGRVFYGRLESVPVNDSDKKVSVRSALIDVTERRQAEEALRRQAELLDLTHDAIIACDQNHRIFFWNRGAEERYGWTSDEVQGKTTDDLLRTVYSRPRQEIELELLLHGRWEGELTDTTRDGRKIIVASRQALRRDADGEPIAILEINSDITEHKHLDEERQRLAGAVEHTGEAVIIMDPRFIIRYVNPAFTKATGYAGEEAVGRDGELLSNDPDFSRTLRETLEKGHPWLGIYQFRHKNGAVFPASTSISSITDSSGAITNYVLVAHDISEQQKLEDQLRQSQKMEAIGTLSGGIAHDFNNILAAIIGFSEMTLDDVSDNAPAHRKVERVLKAALRGRELVKQILDFSRKGEAERKEISLSSIVNETYALLRSSLPATIQMNLSITTNDDRVLANPTQLQQVIMNLATNAADAMRDGGHLTIGLSSVAFPQCGFLPDPDMEPGTYVKLTVTDTGAGMTEEVRQRIFEPFFTTKEKGKGTGMGLAVVYGIVKSHGGAVMVESEVSQGSIFTVFLPQGRKPGANEEKKTISPLPTGSERILFVDDEELLVEMSRDMLKSLGYHVTVAANGKDAWNLFLEDPSRFDLVITDQTMPDVTGATLAQKMLKVRRELPIVLCTGYSEMVSAEKAQEIGIRAFLMKPVAREELAETVRRVLDQRNTGA